MSKSETTESNRAKALRHIITKGYISRKQLRKDMRLESGPFKTVVDGLLEANKIARPKVGWVCSLAYMKKHDLKPVGKRKKYIKPAINTEDIKGSLEYRVMELMAG